MKARINSLENQQSDTRRTFFDLQRATDTYTKLLQRKPSGKDFGVSETNVDLLEDKGFTDRKYLNLKFLRM